NPDPCFAKGSALGECAELGMAHRKVGTGAYSGQEHLTETLVAPRAVEARDGVPVGVDRPAIVALGLGGSAEVRVRQRVQDAIPTGRGKLQRALGRGDGVIIRTCGEEIG